MKSLRKTINADFEKAVGLGFLNTDPQDYMFVVNWMWMGREKDGTTAFKHYYTRETIFIEVAPAPKSLATNGLALMKSITQKQAEEGDRKGSQVLAESMFSI